jgi:capsular polysaccharide transport system permease protein
MARVDDLSAYRRRNRAADKAAKETTAAAKPAENGDMATGGRKVATTTESEIFDELDPLASVEEKPRKKASPRAKAAAAARAKAPAEKEAPAKPLVATPRESETFRSSYGSDRNQRDRLRKLRFFLPLLLVVGLPTLFAAIYYGLIASDLYYTETRISVRSPGSSAAPSLMSSAMGGIQLGSASIEADSIAEFAASHDAVQQLAEQVDIRSMFTRDEGDFISRLSNDASFEDLVEHYKKRVSVVYDQATGIITIGAKTYRPEDSRSLLVALNDISERLVNAFNRRAEEDALRIARSEVERAEQRMADVRTELLRFRLSNQELDPAQRSGGILSIISGLESEYAQVAAELGESISYMDPGSMQITALRNRLKAIEEQIRAEEERLTGTGEDGDRRYANVLNDYELLVLERELAHQEYTSAITSLESARIEAQRQQVYLVPIVQPHEAETARFPQRLENVGLVFLASLLVFLIGRLIITGIQDHLMN